MSSSGDTAGATYLFHLYSILKTDCHHLVEGVPGLCHQTVDDDDWRHCCMHCRHPVVDSIDR
ncbi:hypothetical protein Hanom_Chr15g01393091 [Helianthus anomalus]